jgi:hypothetical protein
MDAFTTGARPVRGATVAPSRCPACGVGDLFILRIARRGRIDGDAVYCAGSYDHDRRRYLRRGCGYAGDRRAGAAEAEP